MLPELTPLTGHLELLTVVLPECRPEQKFCITRLFQMHQTNWITLQGVSELAKETGVSATQAKGSLKYLRENGLLIKEHELPSSMAVKERLVLPQCHPSMRHSIPIQMKASTQQPLPAYIEPAFDPGLHPILVEHVLSNKIHNLKAANRLVLATLIRYANHTGVVRGLGVADLGRLFNMNRDRVNSQLQKLKDLGYIRTSTGGITGKYLFGVTRGAIFLNLKHTKFGHDAKKGITLILKGKDGDYAGTRLVGQQFAQAARNLLMSQREHQAPNDILEPHGATYLPFTGKHLSQPDISKIAKYFQGNLRSGVDDYYQFKIEEYASILLTDEIGRLLQEPENQRKITHTDTSSLKSTIREEIFLKADREKFYQDGKESLPESAKLLVKATSILADHVAKRLLPWIRKIDQVDLDNLHFQIVPCTHETRQSDMPTSFCILDCLFKNDIFKDYGTWIIDRKTIDKFDVSSVQHAESIDVQFQIKHGLREAISIARPFPTTKNDYTQQVKDHMSKMRKDSHIDM